MDPVFTKGRYERRHHARQSFSVALHYSYRRQRIGSTLAARRAGIRQAVTVINSSSASTAANVSGSSALTPYSHDVSTRVSARAPSSPISRPRKESLSPCHRIILITFLRDAPRAIRMPISDVRRLTEYVSKP